MIVYSATKAKFRQDVMTNDIGNIILGAFKGATGKSTQKSEINSWVNSLQYMDRVLNDPAIPGDAGVAIEYHIPKSNKRIDFILTGADAGNLETAILVELKQWQHAALTDKDSIVITEFMGQPRETTHPSYQVWSYKRLLEDYNATVQEENVRLYPCAYLHNYEQDDVIGNKFYGEYTRQAPVYYKADALKLQVRPGFRTRHNYASRPGRKAGGDFSTKIAEAGSRKTAMRFMRDFITALARAARAGSGAKHVLIVEGGPGTGKSVVAINLLVALTDRGLVAQYVTRNSAPRMVYEAKLTGSFKKSHITNMFSGAGSYHTARPNDYDCLIVDEVHRLNPNSACGITREAGGGPSAMRARPDGVYASRRAPAMRAENFIRSFQANAKSRWARRQNAAITDLKLSPIPLQRLGRLPGLAG